jgi:hypothetical protein
MARSVGAWQAAGSRASRQATPHDELRQLAEWWRSKPHPSPATGGAIGVVSTARVQRGPSEAARCASTGDQQATRSFLLCQVLKHISNTSSGALNN